MFTRDDILKAYGVPDFEGAEAEGPRLRICCKTGRMTYLERIDAEKLAAELLLVGAEADYDEVAGALNSVQDRS